MYEICTGVIEGLKMVILFKIEPVYIKELIDKTMGYFNITIHDMIDHLHQCSSGVETFDKEAMAVEHDYPWDSS